MRMGDFGEFTQVWSFMGYSGTSYEGWMYLDIR